MIIAKYLTASDYNRPLVCYDVSSGKYITGILKYYTCSTLSVETETGLKFFNPFRSEFLDCSYYIKTNEIIKLDLTTRFLEVVEYLNNFKITITMGDEPYNFLINDSLIKEKKLTEFIGVTI